MDWNKATFNSVTGSYTTTLRKPDWGESLHIQGHKTERAAEKQSLPPRLFTPVLLNMKDNILLHNLMK